MEAELAHQEETHYPLIRSPRPDFWSDSAETTVERAVRFTKKPGDAVTEFKAVVKQFRQLFQVSSSNEIGLSLLCGDEVSPGSHAWHIANEMKLFWRAIRLAGRSNSELFGFVDLEALELLSNWAYETSTMMPYFLRDLDTANSSKAVMPSTEGQQRIAEGNTRAVGLVRRLETSLREFSDAVAFEQLLNGPIAAEPEVIPNELNAVAPPGGILFDTEELFRAILRYSEARRTSWDQFSDEVQLSFHSTIFCIAFDLAETVGRYEPEKPFSDLASGRDFFSRGVAIVKHVVGHLQFEYPQGIGSVAGVVCAPYEFGKPIPTPAFRCFLAPLRLALELMGSELAKTPEASWWGEPLRAGELGPIYAEGYGEAAKSVQYGEATKPDGKTCNDQVFTDDELQKVKAVHLHQGSRVKNDSILKAIRSTYGRAFRPEKLKPIHEQLESEGFFNSLIPGTTGINTAD